MPGEIVMKAEDMVDAALAGFDQGELFTVPSLPDATDWQAYENSRQKLLPNLSRSLPAERYRRAVRA
jgi:short-subunit dehydrogenase